MVRAAALAGAFFLAGGAIPLIGGILMMLALVAFAWSRSEAGSLALERMRMRLPVVGDILTKFQFAQFCRTLSTLLAGGTPLVQAMETSGDAIRGRLVSGAITRGAKLVREGQSLHDGLASTGLVPELALEMIEVGDRNSYAPMSTVPPTMRGLPSRSVPGAA